MRRLNKNPARQNELIVKVFIRERKPTADHHHPSEAVALINPVSKDFSLQLPIELAEGEKAGWHRKAYWNTHQRRRNPRKKRSQKQRRLSPMNPSPRLKAKMKKRKETVALSRPVAPENLSPSYFVSATYDGRSRKALIKLYEPTSGKIYFWYDNTGHKPYCLTNLSPYELKKIDRLMKPRRV
jgi:hypothetical protein